MTSSLITDKRFQMTREDRQYFRRRPLKAWRHFRKLMQNKEDTEQVFHIIQALNGKSVFKDFKAFMKSEDGQKRFSERRELPTLLDDHARWEALPKGTVGRAYVDFMRREGLTAQGLVDEYDSFKDQAAEYYHPDVLWYVYRRRDTHDLCHVLTGYGRDALGEACVLGFSHGQNRGLGIIFIAYMAGREVRKSVPNGAPVLKAVRQGFHIGNAARKIARQDIISLMEEPLDAARARLGIADPTYYETVHARCEAVGIDPYQAISAQAVSV